MKCLRICGRISLFILSFAGFSMQSTRAELPVQVSQLAQKLYLLDQLSESLPSFFTLPEYQEKIPLTLCQKELLDAYRKVRTTHQKFPSHFITDSLAGHASPQQASLFAPHPASMQDPILDVFFVHERLEDALTHLEGVIDEKERALIKETFAQFDPLFHRLYDPIFSTMRSNVETILETMQKARIEEHFRKLRHFYQAEARTFKSVHLMWRPDAKAMSAQCYGDHLILLLPATLLEDKNAIEFIVSLLVHEATHHISGLSSDQQKSALSKVFLDELTPSCSDHGLMLLEEPLVQATQLVFIEGNYPGLYEVATSWLLQGSVKAFYPLVKFYLVQGKSLDEAFMHRLRLPL